MAQYDLGKVVGDNGVDGATIWTTSTAPTTPNYTFTISDLIGVTGATIKVGDIIIYSYYWYSVTSVSSTTVLASNRTSIRGAKGDTGANGTDGVGITSIEKTSTSGLIDTYTITYSDGDTDTFTVTNGDSGKVYYGTCSTSPTAQVKEITTSSDYTLEEGTVLFVKFTYGQTYGADSTNKLQLKVNSEANVSVVIGGTMYNTQYHWKSGEMVAFAYDGTNYVIVNEGTASTNYYGVTKLVDSVSSTSTDMSATPNSVKTAYDLANSKADAVHTHSTSQITDFPSIPTKISDLTNDSDFIETSSTAGLIKNDGSVMSSGTGAGNWAVGNHTHSGYVSATKVTSWSSTVSDSNVPSEKLVKDTLDSLEDLIGDAITYINQ